MLLPVYVPLSLFQLECSSLNEELVIRAQQIFDLYVQFSVNQHRDLVKELARVVNYNLKCCLLLARLHIV